jgi:hypothetical protein
MKPIKIKNNEGTITICNEWQACYYMDSVNIAYYFKTCKTNYVLYKSSDNESIRYFNILIKRLPSTGLWSNSFVLGIFQKEYESIYGLNSRIFSTAEEAMDRFDSFFIKLKKLKAFL